MPRRSPPTPLRLHVGPLPPRGMPKHTMPSLPRPAFYGAAPTVNPTPGPIPRPRMTHTELPLLVIPEPIAPPAALSALTAAAPERQLWSGPSSPTSAESTRSTPRKKSREFARGPWDHSGAIHVPFNIGAVLPPPMPAALNVTMESKGFGSRRPCAV